MVKIATITLALLFSTAAYADPATLKDRLACTPDGFKFCAHLKTEKESPTFKDQVISCLMSHREELRSACDAAFKRHGN
jgi:hypothetical protein